MSSIALALIFFASAVLPESDRTKKIVLIAGPLDAHPHDTHEYERTIILLKQCLDTSPTFRGVRVEMHFKGWPEDAGTLEDADAIFLTSGGCDRKLEDHPLYVGDHLQCLERQVKRGCGVIFFHWATFHPSKYHDLITEAVGGYFDYENGPPPRRWVSKIETRDWTTTLGAPDHPIARGVSPFKVKEEFYYELRFRDEDPRLKFILLKDGGLPRSSAVGWAVERKDGGRGFGFTGGHFFANWWLPDFRKLIVNALAWTAKIEVPEGGVRSALEAPARVLIVTGHHHPAHDWKATTAALIHVLEQDPRLRVEVSEDPEDLGKGRLGGVDLVLLNYSNWEKPGLSDAAKAGFLEHLRRGGGLTVIHGANGAWNASLAPRESDWEEYRTKIVRRAWMKPGSGHDPYGPFRVEVPLTHHPITEGLSSFDTTDELYFKQVGSLPIEPLAMARSQTTGQEEPLAFAYEYENARVFQTLLGHSAESIRKAGALIRRGAVWAARRSPLAFDPPLGQLEAASFRPGCPWTDQPPPQEGTPKASSPAPERGKQ